ncbi:MAG: 50S ribosomal protein L24 [Fimbriimonadaceae bacterium]
MTKAEIARLAQGIKLKVRKGDRVMIITGKDKGQVGFIEKVFPKRQRVVVLQENQDNPDQPLPLNAAIRHRKARTQAEKSARIKIAVPIHISNVMVLDPKTQEPSRIGRRLEDKTLIRFAKKSGEKIIDQKVMEND